MIEENSDHPNTCTFLPISYHGAKKYLVFEESVLKIIVLKPSLLLLRDTNTYLLDEIQIPIYLIVKNISKARLRFF